MKPSTRDIGTRHTLDGGRLLLPFHAAVMAVSVPLLAAVLLLALFGAGPVGLSLVLSALAPACLLGSLPAFFSGRLDGALARKGWTALARLAAIGGIGAAAGGAILTPLYLTDRIHGAMPLLLPLALAVSGVTVLGMLMLAARLLLFLRSRAHDGEAKS